MTDPIGLNVVIENDVIQVSAPTASPIATSIAAPFTVVTLDGPPGPRGLPGEGVAVLGETPAGTKDGTNLVFTLANNFQAGTVAMYRNGIRGQPGYDFNETLPNQITITTAPNVDDAIIVDYYIG